MTAMDRDDILEYDEIEETFMREDGDVAEELDFGKEENGDDDFPAVDEEEEVIKVDNDNLSVYLRNELMRIEPCREPMEFEYKGQKVKLTVMAELKADKCEKFVFKKPDGGLTAIRISELKVL